MPIKQTCRYAMVPSTASTGVDMTRTMGCTRASSSTVSTSETVSICMICEPMETAVVLATPSNCPMINRSAMP